jgi:hypothetical protein
MGNTVLVVEIIMEQELAAPMALGEIVPFQGSKRERTKPSVAGGTQMVWVLRVIVRFDHVGRGTLTRFARWLHRGSFEGFYCFN